MLTRSYIPNTQTVHSPEFKGTSVFRWCRSQCDKAKDLGIFRFTLDPKGPVEWEHVLTTAIQQGLDISSDEDGVITLKVK